MRHSANDKAVDMYIQALRTIEINTAQKQMLIGHAQAAGMKLSVTKIGEAGGYEGSSAGRLHYGRMARKLLKQLVVQLQREVTKSARSQVGLRTKTIVGTVSGF